MENGEASHSRLSKIALVFLAMFATFTLASSPAFALYDGWNYNAQVNLSVASGSIGPNYKELLYIPYQAGQMETDFEDIRFSDSAKAVPLNYSFENFSASSYAYVWVNFSETINTTNRTIAYLFYGNNTASNISNASAVFDYYDDFESGVLTGWTNSSGTPLTLETSTTHNGAYALRFTDPDAGGRAGYSTFTTRDYDDNYTYEYWYRLASGGTYNFQHFSPNDAGDFFYDISGNPDPSLKDDGGVTMFGPIDKDSWERFKFVIDYANHLIWYYWNGTLMQSGIAWAGTGDNSPDSAYIETGGGDITTHFYDEFRAYPYYDGVGYSIGVGASSGDITIVSPLNQTYASQEVDLLVANSTVISSWWFNYNTSLNVTFTPNTTITAPEGMTHLTVFGNSSGGTLFSEDVYFSVDTTAPTITIQSPTAQVYRNQPTIDLNVSADEAVTTWTYNLNGSGNNTFTPNETVNPLGADNITLDVYAEDSVGNVGYAQVVFTNTWLYFSSWSVSDAFEFEDANFSITVNASQNVVPVGNFSFNETWRGYNYSSSSGVLWTFISQITMPNISGYNETVNVSWNTTTNFESLNLTNTSTSTIYTVAVTDCSLGISGVWTLNFTFEDEINRSDNVNDTLEAVFWVWKTNQYDNNTFNFTLNETTGFKICLYPPDQTLYADATMEYYADNYRHRNYYLSNATLTNQSTEIQLFQINNTYGEAIAFHVTDVYAVDQEGVIIKNLRYYTGNNAYLTVAMGKTDFDGNSTVYLQKNNWYRFILEKNGTVLGQYPLKLLTTNNVELVLPETFIEWFNDKGDISYACGYNNVTTIFSCTVTDTSGKMASATLDVYQLKALNYSQLICENSGASSAITLTCNLSESLGVPESNVTDAYSFALSAEYLDDSGYLATYTLSTGSFNNIVSATFGLVGVFVAFLLVIGLGFMGMWNPVVSILLQTLAIIVSYMFSLVAISHTAVMGLVVVAMLVIWKLES